jgi:putative membrane protein
MFSHAALNAFWNGTSGILLACAYTAIRNGKVQIHKRFMMSVFAVSTVFPFSYLLYHYRVGHVPFQGQGWIRPVYFVLLTSHTILAIVIFPMILITLRRALLERFDKHRIIARWRFPYGFVCVLPG